MLVFNAMNNMSLSKALSWKELALLYAPRLKPKSAVRRLKLWVLKHEILHESLIVNGWDEQRRVLTPQEVKIIFRFLGRP